MNYIGTGYALESLRAEIGRMQLQDRVKTLGVIQDRNRLADYYAASDLFLFPSFYDNAPLVVREAAAMGTPALVPQGSTTAEVISDGRNGFCVSAPPRIMPQPSDAWPGRRAWSWPEWGRARPWCADGMML